MHLNPAKPIVLAIDGSPYVYGVRKFHKYVGGRHFAILTDHKPLLTIFGPDKSLPVMSQLRLQRLALVMMSLDYHQPMTFDMALR